MARAVPPEPKIPEDALKRSLIPMHQNQITERIKWWKDMFVNTRKSKDIIEARKGLIKDYNLYNSSRYKFYFGVKAPLDENEQFEKVDAQLGAKIEEIIKDLDL